LTAALAVRAFLARRLLQAVTVIAVVTTVTFFLIHLAPGDPLGGGLDDPRVSEALRQYWRHVYGFDQPVGIQYLKYVSGVIRGQLGYSLAFNEPVSTVMARALPNTAVLAGSALILSFLMGVLIALVQVALRGSMTDRVLGWVSLALYCTPDFWLAQVALLVFAYWLPIFPAGGIVDPVLHPYLGVVAGIVDRLRHLALPALTLAALTAALVARFQRAALLDVAADDYLRTARAKGVPEWAVIVRHALRNAALPVISLFGLSLPGFLTGAVFVEKIFSWPGLGALAVDAVAARDYPVVIACALVASIFVAIGSLTADVLYAVADPRLRYAPPVPASPAT
jgi:peptide/nickel transport system permease protein